MTRMPRRWAVRVIRQAISPRLAMRTEENIAPLCHRLCGRATEGGTAHGLPALSVAEEQVIDDGERDGCENEPEHQVTTLFGRYVGQFVGILSGTLDPLGCRSRDRGVAI